MRDTGAVTRNRTLELNLWGSKRQLNLIHGQALPPSLGTVEFILSPQPEVQALWLETQLPGSPTAESLRGSSSARSPCWGANQPCPSQSLSPCSYMTPSSVPQCCHAPDELLWIKHLPSAHNIKEIWKKMREHLPHSDPALVIT